MCVCVSSACVFDIFFQCMYVYIHMYIYIYISAYNIVYIYIHTLLYVSICTLLYVHIYIYTLLCVYIHIYIYRYVRHILYVQWYTSTTVACDSTIHAAQRLFLFLFELPLEARLHCLSPCQIEKNTRRRRRNMLSFRKALRLEPCKKMICKYLFQFFFK